MSIDSIAKCPFCGTLYTQYAFSAANQTACSKCVQKAQQQERKEFVPDNLNEWMGKQ